MATYALIKNSCIANLVEWNGTTSYHPDADEIVPIESLPPGIGIGWRRDGNGSWIAPPPPEFE